MIVMDGYFGPLRAGAIRDRYIELSEELDEGETITAVDLMLVNAALEEQADAIDPSPTISDTRVDFRINCPETAGQYILLATFTTSDDQELPYLFSQRIDATVTPVS